MEIKANINFKPIVISLVVILATLELSPFLLGSLFLEQGYSRRSVKQQISQTDEADLSDKKTIKQEEAYLSEHMVHPYVGFIHKPDEYYNDFGYPHQDPLLKKTGNTINICLTGGSVAKQLFQNSTDVLIGELNRHPSFIGKNIQVVSVALGGFKQPQQLLAVNYLLSLGAEYDYVINLDGFNEVVLPYADNYPFHIHPTFPRHWNVYSRKTLNQETILLLGKQQYLLEQHKSWTRKLDGSILSSSNFVLFSWKISEQRFREKMLYLEQDMKEVLSRSEVQAQTLGPPFQKSDTLDYFQFQADYWRQCSEQLSTLAQGSNFTYLHFLQPNQYLPGSKELTSEELQIAYQSGDFAYKKAVELGYPLLIAEGAKLMNSGVQFTDLTLLFKEEKAAIYSDKCCHFNKEGYDAIALQLARAIISNSLKD